MKLKKRTLHKYPAFEEFGLEKTSQASRAKNMASVPEKTLQTVHENAGPSTHGPAEVPPEKNWGVIAMVLILAFILILIISQKSCGNSAGDGGGAASSTSGSSAESYSDSSADNSNSSDYHTENPASSDEDSAETEPDESSADSEDADAYETDDGLAENISNEQSETYQAFSKITLQPGSIWQTGSSVAAKKQFVNNGLFQRVLNYAGMQDDPYIYQLVSVTNVNGFTVDDSGTEYVYYLDNGIRYYLHEDNDEQLECHWEPDGYSASDSLIIVPDNITENTQMIDLGTSDTSDLLVLESQSFSVFSGYYGDYVKDPCLALNLKNPILIKTSSGETIPVHSVQVYGDPVDNLIAQRNIEMNIQDYEFEGFLVEKTSNNLVSGRLHMASKENEYTPVVMEVTGID